jgi:sugar lactone lactonase YvrE
MCIDNEGMLWVAKWGAYQVQRIDPLEGKIINQINLPTSQVTSCSFGGKDLDVLYITTASIGQDMKDEYAGALFKVIPGVKERESFPLKAFWYRKEVFRYIKFQGRFSTFCKIIKQSIIIL